MNATKKWPCEGFKRPWPPLIKMDESGEGEGGAKFEEARLTNHE